MFFCPDIRTCSNVKEWGQIYCQIAVFVHKIYEVRHILCKNVTDFWLPSKPRNNQFWWLTDILMNYCIYRIAVGHQNSHINTIFFKKFIKRKGYKKEIECVISVMCMYTFEIVLCVCYGTGFQGLVSFYLRGSVMKPMLYQQH